jgi:PmbA protein
MTYKEAREYLLKRAAEEGIDLEVLTSESRELTLDAHGGELSQITQASQGGLGLRVVKGGKTGYAYSEERSKEALDWGLGEAVENAELQSETGGFLPQGHPLGETDIIGEGLSAPVTEKAGRALDLEAGLRQDARLKQVVLARYSEREVNISLASTQGAEGGYRSGISGLMAFYVMAEGGSLKQGWNAAWAKEFHSLEPGRTALDMTQRTGRLLGAKPLTTGRYTAYFEPKAFAQLLGVFSSMFSGKAVVEGKSRLAGKLGERVASERVTLIDDPNLDGGLASRPFDGEGTPSRSVKLIENGVLRSFLHNAETAKALGHENTGHAARSYRGVLGVSPTNLYLEAGSGVTLQKGVIVTNLSGLHAGANPITGELSVQGLGLLVEGGEIAYPVENFAVSGRFLELLERVTGLGDKIDWEFFGMALGAPMVEVAELSFAGA